MVCIFVVTLVSKIKKINIEIIYSVNNLRSNKITNAVTKIKEWRLNTLTASCWDKNFEKISLLIYWKHQGNL